MYSFNLHCIAWPELPEHNNIIIAAVEIYSYSYSMTELVSYYQGTCNIYRHHKHIVHVYSTDCIRACGYVLHSLYAAIFIIIYNIVFSEQ